MTHTNLSSFVLFGTLWIAQVAVPGPNFVRVSTAAMNGSRSLALLTSAGTATGNALWCLLAAIGAAALVATPMLGAALRLGGAIYFTWYGLRLLKGVFCPSQAPIVSAGALNRSRAYFQGLATALASPQAIIFFATALTSAFTTLTAMTSAAAALIVIMVTLGWYALIILFISAPRPRSVYLRAKPVIEGIFSIVMLAAALRLAISI